LLNTPMLTENPTIFAIKRYALHDGPNIRTTIFFKGCPLSCHWCHNPEGIEKEIRIITHSEKCVGCNSCVDNCPEKALSFSGETIQRDINSCSQCGICVDVCPALCHEAVGWKIEVRELIKEILKDLPFYDQSGGGVTFSGGEPLLQPKSLLQLLLECGKLDIHRTVDTSGFAPTETLMTISRETDLFLFDIKHMDSRKHQFYTGVSNELILHNFRELSVHGHQMRARIPLISGVNDDETNIRATGLMLSKCPAVLGVDVLPYHPSAQAKYSKLGLNYPGENMHSPENSRINTIVLLLKEYGLDVRVGG